jgi:S-layer protein
MTPAQQTDAYRFFAIAFGAAPGVTFMNQIAQANEGGAGTQQIVNAFTSKEQFTRIYPLFLTNEQFANKLVTNVVGSSASDAAKAQAAADLVAALNSGKSRGDVVFQVFNNLANLTGDATWGNLAKKLDNQVATSRYYTETLLRDSTDVATLQNVLTGVTETTDVSTAALEARLNPPQPVAGQTFPLTTGTDTSTGGAGADTFDGSLTAAGAQTLNSTDRLDGGAGTDTLNATVNASVTPTSLANIENINLTATANTPIIDLVNAGQVTSIRSQATTSAMTVNSIVGPSVALAVADSAVNHTFGFRAASIAGTADSASVTLSNVTGGTLTLSGIETVNVASRSSANTVAIAAANAGTVNLSGDVRATVTLDAATLGLSRIDASTSTGGATVTLTNQTGIASSVALTVAGGTGDDRVDATLHTQSAMNLSGGAGNDTFTFGGNLEATDTLNGGDGVDTIITTNARAQALDAATPTTYTLTNNERIEITDALDGTLVLANLDTSLNTVNLTLANNAGGVIFTGGDTITGPAGALTVNVGGSTAGNNVTATGSLTVNDTGTATTDSLTINNLAVNSTTGLNVNIFNGQDITSGGYENVTINVGAANFTSPTTTLGTVTITSDSAAANTSLTLTGSNDVSMTGVSTNSTGLLTINASAINAGTDSPSVVIGTTTSGTGGTQSITGSVGNDQITVGNFASTIIGGAGNDTLTGGTAADNIQGDVGNDQIVGGGRNDVISAGDGNDTITVTAVAGVTNNVNIDAGAGNDLITMSGSLTQGDTVNGGDGNDTIVLTNDDITAVNALSITNVVTLNNNLSNLEVVRFANGLAQSVDVGRLDGISALEFGTLATGALTVSGLAATNSARLTDALGQTLTLALGDATGTADVVNMTIAASGNVAVGTVQVAGVESVNLTATDTDAGTANAAHTITLTDTDAAADDKLATITVTGNAASLALTLTGTTKLSTLNAAAFEGGLTASLASTIAATVTGGLGADSLVGAGGNDSISGGSGSDIIDGGLGADTLAGGTGTNTLEVSSGLTVGTTTDTNGNQAIQGIVVNLGATALSAAAVNTATGLNIAGTLASIPASSSGYLFTNNTNLSSPNVDTLSGFVRVVGTSGADYIVGTSAANTITGGQGADVLSGGLGADTFVFAAGDAGTISGTVFDTITDYATGTSADLLDLSGTAVVRADGAGINVAAAEAGGGGGLTITAAVVNGVMTIGGADGAQINTLAEYLAAARIVATANLNTLAFVFNGDTYVYQEVNAGGDLLIKLTGVTTATSVVTTAAANGILIG